MKQLDTIEEYKQQFLQLVCTVKLYGPTISDTLLVTRFIMGLKEELRATVEMQIPTSVQLAALYASVQEGLLLQQKIGKPTYAKSAYTKTDSRSGLSTSELWKSKQLISSC